MTLAVLELNDLALRIQREDGQLSTEPGFSLVTAQGIISGEEARALAWREPQHSYNQYWRQLNQTPLPGKQKLARHHADIAFAQLKHLHHHAGNPDQLILAVPGSFNNQQLSLLLGLVKALPADVVAVVDSGLASCLQLQQKTLFVDLLLHNTVLTLCGTDNGSMSVMSQEVIPDLGLLNLYNVVSRHISHLLVKSHRYDPLHTSESEQAIFDQIPGWLMQLCWETEISAALPSPQGELPFILRRENLIHLISERMESLQQPLTQHREAALLLSQGAAPAFGLLPQFSETPIAPSTICIDNCLKNKQAIVDASSDLHRMTTLQHISHANPGESVSTRQATHLLYQNSVYPLKKPVSIQLENGQISLKMGMQRNAQLTLILENNEIKLLAQENGLNVVLPQTVEPGETFSVDKHQLTLVEVTEN